MDRRLLCPCLCILLLAASVLTGCSLSLPGAGRGAAPTATAAGPTPTAGPPTPTNVPAGWQVYSGPHFTIAYPLGGSVSSTQEGDSTAQQPDVVYAISTAQDKYEVDVDESDGLDNATIQNNACRNPMNDPTVMFAGLPMRYAVGAGGSSRNWLFITNKGTVYQLEAVDLYQGKAVQAQDDAILTTFRAQYTTPGCA